MRAHANNTREILTVRNVLVFLDFNQSMALSVDANRSQYLHGMILFTYALERTLSRSPRRFAPILL